jgi:hypothetical protein
MFFAGGVAKQKPYLTTGPARAHEDYLQDENRTHDDDAGLVSVSSSTNLSYACPLCRLRSPTRSALKTHLIAAHLRYQLLSAVPARPPYSCPRAGCVYAASERTRTAHHLGQRHEAVLLRLVRQTVPEFYLGPRFLSPVREENDVLGCEEGSDVIRGDGGDVIGCDDSDVIGCEGSDVIDCDESDVIVCEESDVIDCDENDFFGLDGSNVNGGYENDLSGRYEKNIIDCDGKDFIENIGADDDIEILS